MRSKNVKPFTIPVPPLRAAREASAAEGDDAPATLQSRLERADDDPRRAPAPAGADRSIQDPVALLRYLDVSGRFHRDGRLGRIYHRGTVSLRENVATDSLHVSVDDNHLSAHVDGVSPLAAESPGPSRYAVHRVLLHNVYGAAQDLVWLLRGRQGDHSCVLDCEWIAEGKRRSPPLLDPKDTTWSVQLEARVAGSLDEARLRAAIAQALAVADDDELRLDVEPCDDDADVQAARLRLQRRAIGLVGRPPLAACLARHDEGDILMLNINHAAADAHGALQALHAIARAYAGGPDDAEPALDFLACRELPVRPAPPPTSVAARIAKRAVERMRDALARPSRLAADGGCDDDGYGFHVVALDSDATARIAEVERAHPDRNVLMAALQLAVGQWNLKHDAQSRQIAVLVPTSLRPDEWPNDVVGNFSVTARVSTSRRERSGPASALKAVAQQNARNKRTRTGIALIDRLRRNGLLTLWAKQSLIVLQPLTGNRHVDAAMLCDLGRVRAPSFGTAGAEESDIRELWLSVPARSPLTLSLGAATVAGRLHLTIRYPLRVFDADATRRFADCLLAQIASVSDLEI